MIRDLGWVEPGTTLYIPFHTFDSNDPSASVTLTGLATTDIEIYKNGSVTQRASDAGYALLDTDGIDFDATTGIHGISIDLADNTTAGFYAAGSQYWVVVASVTVDAATVNFILCTFRIGYQGAQLNTTISGAPGSQTSFVLASGPAEDDALNGCVALIHDVASAVQKGYAVISDYTGASKTVSLTAATTFTIADTDNVAVFGPVNANWGGSVAYSPTRGLSGTALPSAAADAAGGLPISDAGGFDIDNRAPAAAAITNMNVVFNTDFADAYNTTANKWEVDVTHWGSAAIEVPTVAGVPNTNVEYADGVAVGTSVAADKLLIAEGTIGSTGNDTTHLHLTGLAHADDGLNDLLIRFYDNSTGLYHSRWITDWVAATDLATLDEALPATPENAVDTYTVLAIERNVTATADTAAIADAVWEEAIADHSGTVGSTAEALNAAGSAGDPWVTALPGAYGAGSAGFILGTNLNATISSRASQTSVDDVPTVAEFEARTLVAANYFDPATDAVATVTNLTNLPSIPANWLTAAGTAADFTTEIQAGLATQASVDDLPTNAELATALAAADDAVLAAIAALNNLSAAQVNAEVVDALATDTYAEPTGVPASTATLTAKLGYLYMALRNKLTVSGTKKIFYDDSEAAEWEKDVSDDGTTYTETEANAP